MPGRLTIDFGDLQTVIACWQQQASCARPLVLPGISRPDSFLIPSLLHYSGLAGETEEKLVGWQVMQAEKLASQATFANLKSDVVSGKLDYRSSAELAGKVVSRRSAARDFLTELLLRAAAELNLTPPELDFVTFTAPTMAMADENAWQRYRDFLAATLRQVGVSRWRLIEEPWAAAWGVGFTLRPGSIYLFVDIGAVGLRLTAVKAADNLPNDHRERRLRILAQAEAEWADTEAAESLALTAAEGAIRQINYRLSGIGLHLPELEGAVFVGGGCESVVGQWLHTYFKQHLPVFANCPLTAAACGAARLVAGVESCGYIRHDYGLRYCPQAGKSYRYRLVVRGGSFYPTAEPMRVRLKASYEGQNKFALFLYRVSGYKKGDWQQEQQEELAEIIFGPKDMPAQNEQLGQQEFSPGKVLVENDTFTVMHGLLPDEMVTFEPITAGQRLQMQQNLQTELKLKQVEQQQEALSKNAQKQAQELETRRQNSRNDLAAEPGASWVNEENPILLTVASPCAQGEEVLEVSFAVDGSRWLKVTVCDLKTGEMLLTDQQVVRLV